jgi:AraC-like DNA-binding protein
VALFSWSVVGSLRQSRIKGYKSDVQVTVMAEDWAMAPGDRADVFSYHRRLQKVRDFVNLNLCRPITLERAACVASLEPKYFSKYFKTKTGLTFTRWLHDQRIAKAEVMLQSSDTTIDETARALGYTSTRTFYRAFKNRTGVSPTAYRKRMRNPNRSSPDEE